LRDNESKLHGILFKCKAKFRSIDLDFRQPLPYRFAGAASAAAFAALHDQ
jgi:hypothetical protein